MSIQWFPGHMAKARREVTEALKLVDVVIEILDARLPESSRNPMMREVIRQKPTVVVLGKADLADPDVTREYISCWTADEGLQAVAVDNLHGSGLNSVIEAAQRATADKFARLAQKGIRRKVVRAMILGIPNVGKSSLINRLAKRSVAKTGDKPGVTRQQQWIKVGATFELLDTPGILWPKFDDRGAAVRLAWSGAIKSTLLSTDELALEFLDWFRLAYPTKLTERYGFQVADEPASVLLGWVAKRRGAIRPGGEPDLERAADFLLRDVQTGMLGRISFERPTSIRVTDNP